MKSLDSLTLGFIGGGNMAEAIVKGLLAKNIISSDRIIVSDPSPERRAVFTDEFSMRVSTDNARVVGTADVIVLAVKPQFMVEALQAHSKDFRKDQLVISIAAGIRSEKIDELCGGKPAVLRVMPNTPALVGEGVSAVCKGARAEDDHIELAEALFSAVGIVLKVQENEMDAVTSLSGSGPAYVFFWMEAMLKAAEESGFDAARSRELVCGTFKGAVELALSSKENPGKLRERVTSKGGTTEAALKVMTDGGVDKLIVDAVKAAAKRSKELSQS